MQRQNTAPTANGAFRVRDLAVLGPTPCGRLVYDTAACGRLLVHGGWDPHDAQGRVARMPTDAQVVAELRVIRLLRNPLACIPGLEVDAPPLRDAQAQQETHRALHPHYIPQEKTCGSPSCIPSFFTTDRRSDGYVRIRSSQEIAPTGQNETMHISGRIRIPDLDDTH